MVTRSIAEELFDKINEEGYKNTVAPLSIDDKLPDHIFQELKKTMKGKYRFTYELFSNRRGSPKPNGIFELFERYSGDSIDLIRQRMIDYVHANTPEIKIMTTDYFKEKGGTLMMWAYKMSRPSTAGDELALFLLCKIFNRHAVIHTIKGPWCTLSGDKTRAGVSLEDRCDIVLVFIVYGFCEASKLDVDKESTIPSQIVATNSSPRKLVKPQPTKKARSTLSISELLVRAHDKEIKEWETIEKQKNKHRILGLNVDNVLPTGHKKYNTRDPVPMRKRQNERTKCDSVKNKYYSDNLDEYHLEGPKRRRKQNTPMRLRSPSKLRVEAQRKMNLGNGKKLEVGTKIKKEDVDKKPDIKLEESEIKRIEVRNKERNKHKKWPTDARLVHIDGTACSPECMKTSDYHKELDENEFDRINKQKQQEKLTIATASSGETARACEETNSVSSVDHQKQHNELPVATPVENANTSTDYATYRNSTNKLPMDATDPLTSVGETAELSDIESTNSCKNIIDITRESQILPHIAEEENDPNLPATVTKELDVVTEKPSTLKCYNIDKSTRAESNQELPDIPLLSTADILPGATMSAHDTDLMDTASPSDITLPDENLPLLAQNELLDDFETLLSLDNDYDNTNLMPVGGAPTVDIIKEINNDAGVNQDLEIAMDNARFLDENLLLTHNTTDSSNTSNRVPEKIPVSPRGSFRTKTHGIKKLTPEERKDKKFKCEDCEFFAYSRRGVSEHYTQKHGSCICEYCDRYFTNPHALKRHQYDHSIDKSYQCKDCDQEFYFQSELTAHCMKH